MAQPVTIGTRGSKLALWQAEWVRSALLARFPGMSVELAVIKTQGDKILDVPLAQVGGKGLFVKEIEEALRDGRVDIAVHSMKDMPADIPEGLAVGAVPERESPADVLISRDGGRLAELAPAASSARAACAGGRSYATRGRTCGSCRCAETWTPGCASWRPRVSRPWFSPPPASGGSAWKTASPSILDPDLMLPAVGQGALCIEIRDERPAHRSPGDRSRPSGQPCGGRRRARLSDAAWGEAARCRSPATAAWTAAGSP